MNDLIESGAKQVTPSFSIAREGQGDIVYQNHRYLVTPNDDDFTRYVEIMELSELPHIVNTPELGDDNVIVGEIPRDARTVTQLIRGVQPAEGLTVSDVFYMTGQTIHAMVDKASVLPEPVNFNLDQVLMLRFQAEVMIPPTTFVDATAENRSLLLEQVKSELWPEYERFGAVVLFDQFQKGLEA